MKSLERFISAQSACYKTVADEIRQGHKKTHWIWFIFPQINGLGHSETARYYAIQSIEEARAYLSHDLLGRRLKEMTMLVMEHPDKTLDDIFGYPR